MEEVRLSVVKGSLRLDMTTLEHIETKHNYTFPTLYKKLWEDEMLNGKRGFELLGEERKTWAIDVYPTLK